MFNYTVKKHFLLKVFYNSKPYNGPKKLNKKRRSSLNKIYLKLNLRDKFLFKWICYNNL